jgi:hypothetical protein
MIIVTLTKPGPEKTSEMVGKFSARKLAFREAKRAAGLGAAFIEKGRAGAYSGPNGTAWIIE